TLGSRSSSRSTRTGTSSGERGVSAEPHASSASAPARERRKRTRKGREIVAAIRCALDPAPLALCTRARMSANPGASPGPSLSTDSLSTDLAELYRLEPGLDALEHEVDAVRDPGPGDGQLSFFCSNYLWLPVNTRMRLLVR